MKRYSGTIIGDDDDRIVTVTQDGAAPYRLGTRLDLRNHSPTGFSWGYGGSGPAQLALAMCCDVFGDSLGSQPAVYQKVKDRLIAGLPMHEPFVLTAAQVRAAAGPVVDNDRLEELVTRANALLEALHREHPEKLPFYCRDAADELQTAIDQAEGRS